jgi:hypothetical protein
VFEVFDDVTHAIVLLATNVCDLQAAELRETAEVAQFEAGDVARDEQDPLRRPVRVVHEFERKRTVPHLELGQELHPFQDRDVPELRVDLFDEFHPHPSKR